MIGSSRHVVVLPKRRIATRKTMPLSAQVSGTWDGRGNLTRRD
jgi:hypothetical protein